MEGVHVGEAQYPNARIDETMRVRGRTQEVHAVPAWHPAQRLEAAHSAPFCPYIAFAGEERKGVRVSSRERERERQ